MYKGMKHHHPYVAACTLALAAVVGLSGCSLGTPSRSEVAPEPVRTKLSVPVISNKGILSVAIDSTDAPQVMEADDGRYTGYTSDVARAVAQKLGLKVEFTTDAEPADVGGADSADVYIGATEEDETEDISVVAPYLEDAPALFARLGEGESSVDVSLDELSASTVGVQDSSAAQDLLTSAGIDAQQKTYGNVNECLEALAAGEVDYVACDATAGAYLSRAYEGIGFAGTLDSVKSFGFALRVRNAELADAIQEALDELEADGTLAAIHTAWYGDMPLKISGTLISGLQTSEERRAAEEAAKKAEEEASEEEGDVAVSEEDAAQTSVSE